MSLAILKKKPVQEDTAVLVIPIDDLNIDKEYQRDLDTTRGDKMAREWDPYLLNELTVAERADGTYWVIDGMHRWYAAKKRGYQALRCFVVRGLTAEEEAGLFRRLNKNRRAVNAWSDFKAALAEKDRDAIQIRDVVVASGYSIARTAGPRSIKAVSGLQKIHRMGGASLLRDTLTFLHEAWNGDPDATEHMPLVGAATFLYHYRTLPAFDYQRLVRQLGQIPVSQIAREVKGLSDGMVTTGTSANRALLVMRRHYNSGLRTKKLPLPVDSRNRQIGTYSE